MYIPGAPKVEDAELVWLDQHGETERLAEQRQPYESPALSPKGDRVAVHIKKSPDDADLWVYHLDRTNWTQLTGGVTTSRRIVWSPDSRWIVSSWHRSGSGWPKLFRVRADGGNGGNVEPLTDGVVTEGSRLGTGGQHFWKRSVV